CGHVDSRIFPLFPCWCVLATAARVGNGGPPPIVDKIIDYNAVNRWVWNVAMKKTIADHVQIRCYFSGRVQPDVIDLFISNCGGDHLSAVQFCAEQLSSPIIIDE
ncbi:unnamed protein product, partial [Sphacelaria rigidula]